MLGLDDKKWEVGMVVLRDFASAHILCCTRREADS